MNLPNVFRCMPVLVQECSKCRMQETKTMIQENAKPVNGINNAIAVSKEASLGIFFICAVVPQLVPPTNLIV